MGPSCGATSSCQDLVLSGPHLSPHCHSTRSTQFWLMALPPLETSLVGNWPNWRQQIPLLLWNLPSFPFLAVWEWGALSPETGSATITASSLCNSLPCMTSGESLCPQPAIAQPRMRCPGQVPALLLCTGWGASINTPKSSELGMGASKGPFPPHAGVPVLPRAGERTQVPPWLPAPPPPPRTVSAAPVATGLRKSEAFAWES